jgi:hypothetical protein
MLDIKITSFVGTSASDCFSLYISLTTIKINRIENIYYEKIHLQRSPFFTNDDMRTKS